MGSNFKEDYTMKKIISLILIMLTFVNIGVVSASAETIDNVITPRWNNTAANANSFGVSNDIAYVTVEYTGYSATFSRAEVTVEIQKRFLWLFWDTVETWSFTSTIRDDFRHAEIPIDSGTGRYRAKFEIDIYGTDGSVDHIEDEIEYEYK